MIGSTVAQYRILDQIGQGGMGIVYKAEDTRLDRTVALKFLPPLMSADPEAKERFIREAKAASGLDHPNICTVYDIGETEAAPGQPGTGQLFIVMPFYDGDTLKYLLKDGPLPVEDVASIAFQIAEGLDRAHEAGIVHRDLKPANIMVTSRGRVKILDFGVAKLGAESELTKMGSTVGTTAYMSPEQTRGDDVDARTDLWSMGVVLYQMLTGTLPFRGDYEQAIVYGILNEESTPIHDVRPEATDELVDLVAALMKKDRAERPESATAVALALGGTRLANLVGGSAIRAAAPPARLVPTWLAVASGVILLAAVALFAWTRLQPAGSGEVESVALDAVVVLPFDVQAGADLAYLSSGMVTMISPMIDGLGTLRAVDQRAVLGWVDQRNDSYIDPADGREIAQHFGAGRYILGSILQAGPEVRLSASLYNASGDIEKEASASYDDEAELLTAVDGMLQSLFAGTMTGAGFSLSNLVGSTTSSFAAMKAYMKAEQALRRGDGPIARELAAEAVEHDSTFALGWYLRGRSHAFNGDVETAKVYFHVALRHAATASVRVRDLIEARLASTEGRQEDALLAMERLVRSYPDDLETTGLLGDTYYHTNSILGRRADRAIPYFEQVLRYDPDNGEYLGHLAALYARNRRWQSLDSLYQASRHQVENTQLPLLEGLHVFHFGDVSARDSVIAARILGTGSLGPSWFLMHLSMAEMADAFTEFTEAMRGEYVNYEVDSHLAFSRVIRGQPEAALLAMKDTERAPDWLFLSVAPALLPYLPADADSLAAQRARLAAWDTVATPLSQRGGSITDYEGFQRDALAQRLGMIAERQGDVAFLYELASDLASRSTATELTHAISHEVRARALLVEGRAEEALASIDSAVVTATWISQFGSGEVNGYQRRFLKARILFELGEYENAARWANSVHDGFQVYMLELLPSTLLLEAESYERLGESDRAIERYTRFVDLWKDAEPELQPAVDEMQSRLNQLLDARAREPRR